MQAKDIMSQGVVTIQADLDVAAVAELLLEHSFSAVPVLDEHGRLVGIVSEGDLIRRLSGDPNEHRSWWLKIISSRTEQAREFVKIHGRTAADVMTRNVVSVDEGTDIGEIARVMEIHGIKRVPVLRDGEVVGIVSRSNLLQVVAGRKEEIKRPVSANDRDVRIRVHDTLTAQGFVTRGSLNVIVDDGVVDLWGWVESETERDAIILAANEIAGVKEVRDHFGMVAPYVWGT